MAEHGANVRAALSGVTPDLLELVAKCGANLKVAHGQLREIERAIASMPQEAQPELSFRCDHCIGGQGFKSLERLEEHLANVHAIGLEESIEREALAPALIPPMVPGSASGLRRLDAVLPDDRTGSANEADDAA